MKIKKNKIGKSTIIIFIIALTFLICYITYHGKNIELNILQNFMLKTTDEPIPS